MNEITVLNEVTVETSFGKRIVIIGEASGFLRKRQYSLCLIIVGLRKLGSTHEQLTSLLREGFALMKKDARLIAELSVLGLSLLGIVSQLSLSKRRSDALAQFSFYTLQTNFIVLIVAL